ncbi:MAG: hypothetical protein A3F31_03185 [Candidatus Levybacteria bacterium RIFCSPHIGHO2_12_FULL_38_12]|nr:MAG: hypothetical protein A3D75_02555 [Candidatus Levybacteria bacterium RIFCSPHIGHO2_02_FULL_37_18]OGH22952.1 MAG: hypothetical protein A3F31_03185 [Candidatus Levybacteria bacterium RIFCSPHIGHO2_12_FULL_38_12]OGH34122.1 MAG: hypothetical protein A3A47_03315 [Candidatus Levybacteria bacterium RIFCSPLOWO2_01_FULL_37_20]OGH44915.1 MAG: hypothetical protein A3J14_00980 [Candidatus Levybacteria bacterium RIFCSPLOWO2_02_FULL_37_18]
MTNHKRSLAYLSLTIASVIWGANGPIMKFVLASIPPFTLAFLRFGGASLILFPFVFKKLSIAKKDRKNVILSAIFGVSLNIGFFFLGLNATTALNAGIIVASLPIFTLIFAGIFLKEKVGKNFVLGSLLGLLGILVIIGKGFFSASISPLGDILILLATLSYVIYEIISKHLKNYSPLTIIFYMCLIGALSFFPFAFLEYQTNPLWIYRLSPGIIMGIVYGIFFSSLAAYVLWQWALWQLQASRVGFFFYLDPIVSTITAVLFLSEHITPSFILGSLLIFLGLFVAEGHFRHYHVINCI